MIDFQFYTKPSYKMKNDLFLEQKVITAILNIGSLN